MYAAVARKSRSQHDCFWSSTGNQRATSIFPPGRITRRLTFSACLPRVSPTCAKVIEIADFQDTTSMHMWHAAQHVGEAIPGVIESNWTPAGPSLRATPACHVGVGLCAGWCLQDLQQEVRHAGGGVRTSTGMARQDGVLHRRRPMRSVLG